MVAIPTYKSIVTAKLISGFEGVNRHDYQTLASNFAPDIHHRFAGDHALGGERHDAVALRKWFERVGRVLPSLNLTITDVAVSGWPTDTIVTARWTERADMADGGEPYVNYGLHRIRIRMGKLREMDVYLDTDLARSALERQAAAGIHEAVAAPILS